MSEPPSLLSQIGPREYSVKRPTDVSGYVSRVLGFQSVEQIRTLCDWSQYRADEQRRQRRRKWLWRYI